MDAFSSALTMKKTCFGECLTWLQQKDISVMTSSSESCNGYDGTFQKIIAFVNEFVRKVLLIRRDFDHHTVKNSRNTSVVSGNIIVLTNK